MIGPQRRLVVIETKKPDTFNEYDRTEMIVPANTNEEAIATVRRRLWLRRIETRFPISCTEV